MPCVQLCRKRSTTMRLFPVPNKSDTPIVALFQSVRTVARLLKANIKVQSRLDLCLHRLSVINRCSLGPVDWQV